MKIGIYALGLIGGSLLKALHGYEKIAVTRNPDTINAAKQYASLVSDDISTLKECDLIFVCSPMNKTLAVLDELETIVSPNTIVADVCSLKKFVTEKKRPYRFIGTHPMAGTENAGFEHSYRELFEGAKWIITPDSDTNHEDLEKLKMIISSVWAKPIIMNPAEHDRCAALISHMPMILAQALMNALGDEKEALKMASSGFRDMTRLAMSNTEMASDMLELNRENIEAALGLLSGSVLELLNCDYTQKITEISKARTDMYNQEGKNVL